MYKVFQQSKSVLNQNQKANFTQKERKLFLEQADAYTDLTKILLHFFESGLSMRTYNAVYRKIHDKTSEYEIFIQSKQERKHKERCQIEVSRELIG